MGLTKYLFNSFLETSYRKIITMHKRSTLNFYQEIIDHKRKRN